MFNGTITVQNGGKHRNTLLGEGIRRCLCSTQLEVPD